MNKNLLRLSLLLFLTSSTLCCQKRSTGNCPSPEFTCPDDVSVYAGETFVSSDFFALGSITYFDISPTPTNAPTVIGNHIEWVTTCHEEGDYVIRVVITREGDPEDSCEFDVNVFNQLTDFPSTIGSRFAYYYFDNLSMSSDTVVVSIVDTMTFDENKLATVWEYTFSSKVDTKYAYYFADTVKVYDDLKNWWSYTAYVFPLEVGKGWRGGTSHDTNTVIDADAISVAAGEFSDGFLIEETWLEAGNWYGHVLTWVVPKVGIVRKRHRELRLGPWADEVWELIEYHISPQK